MKFGVDTHPLTLKKRESLDDSAINVTLNKPLSRRRSLSTGDLNSLLFSNGAVKQEETTRELSENQNQSSPDGKYPSLEDFAKYFTESCLLEGQQKLLMEELEKRNKELETLSWSSKENIGLLKRQLEKKQKEKEAQSKELKKVEVEVKYLRQDMKFLEKKNENDNRQIAVLERQLREAQDKVQMLNASNEANKNSFMTFKV